MTLKVRRLGSTGAEVSEIALGTVTFVRETNEEASAEILGAYLDAGGNLLDTADAYGTSSACTTRTWPGAVRGGEWP